MLIPQEKIDEAKRIYDGQAMEEIVGAGKTKEVFTLPPARGDLLNYLYANANVLDCDYTAEGTVVTAVVDKKTKGFINKSLK